jgi:cation diffusion facilitator family transporter
MATHDLSGRVHDHVFDGGNAAGERRTWIVVAITAVTMVAEIVGGWITGSMALTADGWHMGTHVAALAIAALAYRYARRWAEDRRFAFGTWKIEVLGAFASAIVLAVVAVGVAFESLSRLANPAPIDFGPALVVAAIGLVVNLASAWVLGDGHDHGHDHDRASHPGHEHEPAHEHHHDLNLKSAYAHVLTDALTSILAIVALLAGLYAGWTWMDPAMGLVGAGVIGWWSKGLIAESARTLLDREMDTPLVEQVRAAIENDGDAQVADLHLWRVGRSRYACIVCVVADRPLAADAYRTRLSRLTSIAHLTIEVNACPAGRDCRA